MSLFGFWNTFSHPNYHFLTDFKSVLSVVYPFLDIFRFLGRCVRKVVPIPVQLFCYRLMLVFFSSMRKSSCSTASSRLCSSVHMDHGKRWSWFYPHSKSVELFVDNEVEPKIAWLDDWFEKKVEVTELHAVSVNLLQLFFANYIITLWPSISGTLVYKLLTSAVNISWLFLIFPVQWYWFYCPNVLILNQYKCATFTIATSWHCPKHRFNTLRSSSLWRARPVF